MKGARYIFYMALLCVSANVFAQSDSTQRKKLSDVVQLRGYIKDMQILSFGDNLNDILNDNLIHNRLNFRIYPTQKVTAALEFRNRIFMGESVDLLPNYAELVDVDNGIVDLSWPLIDAPSLVLLTQIDRAWLEYASDDWEVRAGRQRINWGTNLFWNANDLFNAFQLTDFDYEERPGVDALRIQRHFKGMSTLDLAVKPGRDSSDWVGAVMYRFNKWRYDFQVLAGWWFDDLVAGGGWAGNIGNAGFKGETTLFVPRDSGQTVLSASISADYIFGNQLFLTGGFLFNSAGVDTTFQFAQNLFAAPISAKNLMPTKYSALVSASMPFTPLFNGSLVGIWSPGVNTVFLMPSLGYSISSNWEVALFGQSFWMQLDRFRNIGNGVFIRLKGSF